MKKLTTTLLLLCGIIIPNLANAEANTELENYTYKLEQSNSIFQLWTTLPSERVFKNDVIPKNTNNHIKTYLAKNEYEPFLLVVKPNKDMNVKLHVDNTTDLETQIYQVEYVNIKKATDNLGKTGDYPDPLYPVEENKNIQLKNNENTAFWVNVYAPKNIEAEDYEITLQINETKIPIKIHIFDFAIPDELHVKSQMNFSHQNILEKYGVTGTGEDYWFYVEKMKQFFMDHRLTPKSALWSGGLTSGGAPYIDYDCRGNFTDNDGIWGFLDPAEKYLEGKIFKNGKGFPSWMAMTFKNNDASQDQRPVNFCNKARSSSDWLNGDVNSAYNQEWFEYIAAIETYLKKLGYIDQAYFYMANEPQDQHDYDAVAWYSQTLKQFAPDLKLMVSEEPREEIYNHPQYPDAKIDIWLPVLNNYNPEVSHARAQDHNEDTWIYFLHGTRPPYFNPITLDHPGIESKLTGWFLWKYRIRGIAYYSINNWNNNPWTETSQDDHNGDLFMLYPPSRENGNIKYGDTNHRFVSSIRFELMRDSLEDYEYLYYLNSSKQPEVNKSNIADEHADKIINGLTSYNRDSQFMYNLRRLIGERNAQETKIIADITPEITHERMEESGEAFYINFQDPQDQPGDNRLIVDGKEYLKIGWDEYDEDAGYGWYGDMAHVMYRYINGSDKRQNSIIFDDWGRQKTFEFSLPNGIYDVTVSVGWKGRIYQKNYIEIEGINFIDGEASDSHIVRTKEVEIKDNKLTMEMGIFDEYTMLNYLDIVPKDQTKVSTSTLTRTNTKAPKPIIRTIDFSQKETSAKLNDINQHQYKTAIQNLADQKIINGYPNGSFKPEQTINRVEILKILLEALVENFDEQAVYYLENCFNDVSENTWYTPYVCYAKEHGIIEGYPDGSFKPAQAVSNVEAIKIIVQALGLKKSDSGYTEQNPWYMIYLKTAAEHGILPDGGFDPAKGAKRGYVSEVIYRGLN